MLQTRLWMGTVLVLLTAGMLVLDQWLAPWFPFLFVFVLGLSLAACQELVALLGNARRPQVPLLFAGVAVLGNGKLVGPGAAAIWLGSEPVEPDFGNIRGADPGGILLGNGRLPATPDQGPNPEGGSIERMARTLWVLAYLGLLPCFLAQARWLYPANQPAQGSVALALIIFVPKCCDIGAYGTGRLLGRHQMTPVLSPKKTWEGAAGGLTLGTLAAIGIDRLGPVPLLGKCLGQEIGFGVTLGGVGMFGDLAESLVKRDCRRKDASTVVPGFGGVLDVVDSVIFAAPVGYLWLRSLAWVRTPILTVFRIGNRNPTFYR